MILYHGSYIEVSSPDISFSRKNVDFVKGFYTTPLYEQAEKWCMRFKKSGKSSIISIYDFDETALEKLKVLAFDSYSESWLDFIISCRLGKDTSDYDIVSGGVANDKVFNTVELYFDGLIDKTEAISRLKYEKPNMQICFRNQRTIDDFLIFERSITL